MIDTLHDLIEERGKRARSQYTPSKERVRWVKLTGQLIGYKDHVLRNYDFERLAMGIEELRQRLDADDEENKPSIIPLLPSWEKPQEEPEKEKKLENKQVEKPEEAGLYEDSLSYYTHAIRAYSRFFPLRDSGKLVVECVL